MNNLIFKLIYPPLFLISILPFSLLYLISDGLFYILFYLAKYRREVVQNNLKNAFPLKTQKELKMIEKEFYKHLCDLLVEGIKLYRISEKELRKRVRFENPAVFKEFANKGENIITVMGHTGNWEWAGARFALEKITPLQVLYHPLKNKAFDKLILQIRSRFGAKLIPMQAAYRTILKNNTHPINTCLIADQTPPEAYSFWTTFMNQDTPVFTGTAKLVHQLNQALVYVNVRKEGRGKYVIIANVLKVKEEPLPLEAISNLHVRALEESIYAQEFNWLWSHRRWKHKKKL